MSVLEGLRWASAIVGLISAGLAVRAATVHVRDEIGNFIKDIHQQSFWATWSAVATAATALLLVLQTFLYRG